MNERIKKLTELTLNGNMYVSPVKTEFDREICFFQESKERSSAFVNILKISSL